MREYAFAVLCIFVMNIAFGQSDQLSIKDVINTLFDGMRNSDSIAVKSVFYDNAILNTVYKNKKGEVKTHTGDLNKFISAVGQPKDAVWNEILWDYKISVDGALATAWTPYTFYLDTTLSHCGVNSFELLKLEDKWKINRIIDTRTRKDCRTDPIIEINVLIDKWHLAAAQADEDVFFGSMNKGAIYIGTDASERWERDEMAEWAKEYFNRESAWSFTPVSRNITMVDQNVAYFDELLDTWMGKCRSTGVVEKIGDDWKIDYYHLSIAVPNEVVQDYLKLIAPDK